MLSRKEAWKRRKSTYYQIRLRARFTAEIYPLLVQDRRQKNA